MESADTQQFLCIPSSLEMAWAKPVSIFFCFPTEKAGEQGKTGKGNLSSESQHAEDCLEKRRFQKSKQGIKCVPLPTNKQRRITARAMKHNSAPNHRITKFSELEGTHSEHRVQL